MKELIAEIAVASGEQSSGVDEMNKALMQLEAMTQQNAALVEEAAASALTFKEESAHLSTLVGQFRLDEVSGPKTPRAHAWPYKARNAKGDDEWQEF